jgi:hypothetical protein
VRGNRVPTRKEIEDQIAALQAEAESMGDGDDYEIEIWNQEGAGTRLPSKAGEGFLRKHFPELFSEDPPPDGSTDDGQTDNSGTKSKPSKMAPGASRGNTGITTAGKYFGKRPAGK